jgi:pyridoxine 5'-phosphate synthase PdxJ
MRYKTLDMIVLDHDLPKYGLRAGDLGAIVEAFEPDQLMVEFVAASGRTAALVTLSESDVREIQDQDLIAVRTVSRVRHNMGCHS